MEPTIRPPFARPGAHDAYLSALNSHVLVYDGATGTNFQLQVWAALLRLPAGTISSYGDIARAIDAPKAGRAVGAALGQNTVAYLVPCHRVLRATGLFQAYRWGATRRRAMLAWEAAQAAA